jgi:hypothetical protein
VIHSRQEEDVHGSEEQKRASLGEWRVVEERENSCIVGDASADGRIDDATVALDRGGEAAEVVGQR